MHIGMFESFITQHWFSNAAKAIWSDVATLQAWLDVEVALANAQAEVGLVPVEVAKRIESQADAGLFDLERLSRDIAFAQHPFVPVLHQFEALCGEPAAGFIHWGATTQNIFDTASALQMTKTHALLMGHLDIAIDALCALASQHKHTVQAGRTHGQHALPMTFGFKVAAWIDELDRDRRRLAERCAGSFVASMGGAIGTYAGGGPLGRAVEAGMAERLGLQPSGMAMRSSFDRINDYIGALGLLMGTVEKIAQDVVFMQRTEIGEVSEAFHLGKVGSSTMAQKRNPATALLLTSLTRLLRARIPAMLAGMVRMDEGDSSSTNLCDAMLPDIAILGVSVAETLAEFSQGLVVNADAMLRNLNLSNGLIASEALMMRLASSSMGRHEAHKLLYDAAQRSQSEGIPYITAIEQHPLRAEHRLPDNWAEALTPQNYIGASAELVDAAVARASRRPVPR